MVGMRVPLARCGERAGHGDSGEGGSRCWVAVGVGMVVVWWLCQEPGHKCVLFRKKKDKMTLKFKVKVQLALLASHVVILFPLGKCHSWEQCERPEGQMG
jgi:hypothetical protein